MNISNRSLVEKSSGDSCGSHCQPRSYEKGSFHLNVCREIGRYELSSFTGVSCQPATYSSMFFILSKKRDDYALPRVFASTLAPRPALSDLIN